MPRARFSLLFHSQRNQGPLGDMDDFRAEKHTDIPHLMTHIFMTLQTYNPSVFGAVLYILCIESQCLFCTADCVYTIL